LTVLPSSGSNKPSKKSVWKQMASRALVYFSAYSSIPKMEAICSSETSVDFQRPTRRNIPEDSTLHNHRYEKLKSYILCISQVFYACYMPSSSHLHPCHCPSNGEEYKLSSPALNNHIQLPGTNPSCVQILCSLPRYLSRGGGGGLRRCQGLQYSVSNGRPLNG
jgi:hypothetical protein